jgi:hypothetical protein
LLRRRKCKPHTKVRKSSAAGHFFAGGRRHPLRQVQRVQGSIFMTTETRTMPGFVGYVSIFVIFACVVGPALV